jgi:hypothetical protein
MASRPAPAEDIIAATLRQLGVPNPEFAAKRVIFDLAGHGYELVHHPPEPDRCDAHPNTKQTPRGCPTCGPKD